MTMDIKTRLLSRKRYMIPILVIAGIFPIVFSTSRLLLVSTTTKKDHDAFVNILLQDNPTHSAIPNWGKAIQTMSMALASKQSFGFFDDITDSQWILSQQLHAKTFPNHFRTDLIKYSHSIHDKGNVSKLMKSSFWYAENFQEEFHCAYSQRIPSDSNGDGPKWVCDPHRIARQKECLVYSVGSNGNTMFEEGIKREIGEHCEIHTFDMVTRNKRNGDFKERLERIGATFHPWGLGTEAETAKYDQSSNKQRRHIMLSLRQTMEKLNHTGRVVDIFKIDCEWCEWYTYKEWLDVGDLRQILVETHNAPMPEARNFFYSLHDAGYVIFSKEANFQNGGGCVEYSFLKLHPDFFINNTMYSQRQPVQTVLS